MCNCSYSAITVFKIPADYSYKMAILLRAFTHQWGMSQLTLAFLQENDYIASYFEDGDDFGAGSDENMDEGATY